MRVNRESFLDRLWADSQANSVVLTGSPGVGKSWMMAQFMRRCKLEGRPYLPIVAEDVDVQSADELRKTLGFSVALTDMLGRLGDGAVLVIDGLDALRGEPSQRTFREAIRSVVRNAPNCHVLASIRNFDLQESRELQKIFFAESRKFMRLEVPEFSEAEVQSVAAQIPELRTILLDRSLPISGLLRNAFNVTLATQLVEVGVLGAELSTFTTQTHLLDAWWRRRIDDAADAVDRRELLRWLCRAVVAFRTLTVPETEIYIPNTTRVLAGLQSSEILRKSVTERIGFTHNILFDYAVGRLLLDELTVFPFVLEDPTHSIFFRPSISVLFNRLWIHDRPSFWRTAQKFFSLDVPERARIVPAICVFENARSVDDLKPLTDAFDEASRGRAIARVLRAVQSFGGIRRDLWAEWLISLRKVLSLDFLNEYVALLANVAEIVPVPLQSDVATAARDLIHWMWSKADGMDKEGALQLADIAAGRVLPIALRFYDSDVPATRTLVLQVLSRLGKSNASGNEPFWLAHEIEKVFKADAPTAVVVFEKVFGYHETSNVKRAMGSGSILRMTTTRKQQIEGAKHAFQQKFGLLADSNAIGALKLAVAAVNSEIPKRRRSRTRGSERFQFDFHGERATYRSDHSEVWDAGYQEYVSLDLLQIAFDRLTSISSLTGTIARQISKAKYAVFWKKLLEAASVHPAELFELVLPLIIDSRVLAAPETTNAAGTFLSSVYKTVSIKEHLQDKIEGAIIHIPEASLIRRYEKPESIRDRLLMTIPDDQLRSNVLRVRRDEIATMKTEVRANEPYHRFDVTTRSFTTEDYLREQGANVDEPATKELLQVSTSLTTFEAKYLNAIPTPEEADTVLEPLKRLRKLASEVADQSSAEHARGVLCSVAETVLKTKLPKEGELFDLARLIVLAGASDPSPKFDPNYHSNFDMPSWGSPSPRIEAAQGLANYLWNFGTGDEEVLNAFIQLGSDPVPAVRYQIANGSIALYKHGEKNKFWSLQAEMSARETTPGVLLGLLNSLGRIAASEPDKTMRLVEAMLQNGLPETERSELRRSLLNLATGLYLAQGIASADRQLRRFEKHPTAFHEELLDAVAIASHYFSFEYSQEVRKRVVDLWERALDSAYVALEKLFARASVGKLNSKDRKAYGNLLRIVDEIATRLFFSLDTDPQFRRETAGLSSDKQKELYFEAKPVLSRIALKPDALQSHALPAHTAHYLMQLFSAVLRYDPSDVIVYAAGASVAGARLSYQFDSMAVGDLTRFVEQVFADHREVLRNDAAAAAIGELLDLFVAAGWPEAMQLTFRLDEIIR